MTMPFNPSFGSNQLATLAAATPQYFRINKDNRSLRFLNTGSTNPCYFKTYASGATTGAPSAPAIAVSTADYRVSPLMTSLISFDLSHDAIAIISAAGTTVEFCTGDHGV